MDYTLNLKCTQLGFCIWSKCSVDVILNVEIETAPVILDKVVYTMSK